MESKLLRKSYKRPLMCECGFCMLCKKREYNRRYREKNWEKVRDMRKRWQEKNPVSHFYTLARGDFRYKARTKGEILDSDLSIRRALPLLWWRNAFIEQEIDWRNVKMLLLLKVQKFVRRTPLALHLRQL